MNTTEALATLEAIGRDELHACIYCERLQPVSALIEVTHNGEPGTGFYFCRNGESCDREFERILGMGARGDR